MSHQQEEIEIAIAGIAVTASEELLSAMMKSGDITKIREACKKDPHWPAFCAAARAGHVPETWLAGAIGKCVLNWAKTPTEDEHSGMSWFNGLPKAERDSVLAQTEKALGRQVAVSDAWELWKANKIRLTSHREK